MNISQEIMDKIGEFISWKVAELKRVEWESENLGFDWDKQKRNALKIEIKALQYSLIIAKSVIENYEKGELK